MTASHTACISAGSILRRGHPEDRPARVTVFTVYQGDGVSEEILMSFRCLGPCHAFRVSSDSDRYGYESRP